METTEKTSKATTESKESVTKSPGIPEVRRNLKKSVTWQRVSVSLLGIVVLLSVWQFATWHLYSLPPEAISAFTTITVNVFYAIAALVIFFVTGKMIYDMKVDTIAHVITEGKNVFERQESKEHVIMEGDPGAPTRRPFAPDASHD